jgi:hypothetical protein
MNDDFNMEMRNRQIRAILKKIVDTLFVCAVITLITIFIGAMK